MDAAGTGVQSDMLAQDDDGFPIDQRMGAGDEFQLGTAPMVKDLILVGDLSFLEEEIDHLGSYQPLFAANGDKRVIEIRMQANSKVGRDGPGCSGPNDHVGVFRQNTLTVSYFEFYVNGGGFHIRIFNLGFCQSSFAMRAPINRLQAFINIAFLGHFGKSADLRSFKIGIQSDIGMIPIAGHAQTTELFLLRFHIAQCKLFAAVAEHQLIGIATIQAQSIDRLGFNRQTMGIPAGHVRRVITAHRFIFNDHILEHFIQSMAQMNIAVGIRRPVMEDEFWLAGVLFQNAAVNAHFIPLLQNSRFLLRQVAAHFKIGLRQIQSCAVFVLFLLVSHVSSFLITRVRLIKDFSLQSDYRRNNSGGKRK